VSPTLALGSEYWYHRFVWGVVSGINGTPNFPWQGFVSKFCDWNFHGAVIATWSEWCTGVVHMSTCWNWCSRWIEPLFSDSPLLVHYMYIPYGGQFSGVLIFMESQLRINFRGFKFRDSNPASPGARLCVNDDRYRITRSRFHFGDFSCHWATSAKK
jgi:hypothetical protein